MALENNVPMPTLIHVGRYRFSIVMADCIEPPHAHVSGGGGACKIWLRPISIARTAGYSRREENAILEFAQRYEELLLRRWNEICPPPT